MTRIATESTLAELRQELEVLEHRLTDGERRIEDAIQIGTDVSAWEAFWIELLHTYEAVHQRLEAAETEREQLAA